MLSHQIKNRAEFNLIWGLLANRIRVGTPEFPNVFKEPSWSVLKGEFDYFFGPRLLELCNSIAVLTKETQYHFVSLDPRADEYFNTHFDTFGAISITASETATQTWSLLEEVPECNPADAMVYAVDVFAIIGESARWAVFGSRDDEMVLVGADVGVSGMVQQLSSKLTINS